MSPEHASVIIVDDDEGRAYTLKEYLKIEGHRIIGTATSRKEAEEIISKTESLDVALLDGNLDLTESNPNMIDADGRYLAKIVREKFPKAKVISISGRPQDWSDTPFLQGSEKIAKEVTKA